MRTWQAAAAAAGAAAALTIGGLGIADAATAIPPNTLHGCVTGSSRALTHVYSNPGSGTKCASGFQVVWPNGADNDPAPQQVTAGPGGLDVVFASEGTNIDVAVAACPVDHPYVLGGGYTSSGSVVTDIPRAPSPPFVSTANTGGWTVQGAAGSHVAAYAVCAK